MDACLYRPTDTNPRTHTHTHTLSVSFFLSLSHTQQYTRHTDACFYKLIATNSLSHTCTHKRTLFLSLSHTHATVFTLHGRVFLQIDIKQRSLSHKYTQNTLSFFLSLSLTHNSVHATQTQVSTDSHNPTLCTSFSHANKLSIFLLLSCTHLCRGHMDIYCYRLT